MSAEGGPDTRSRILAVATELFLRQGYVETSLSQIGRELGLTKAAILYHFPAKELILTELAEPMLVASERVLDTAERLAPEQARWAVIEGILDVSFAHLPVLAIANAAWVLRDPVYRRVVDINTRAMAIIAGPGAGLAEGVRASATLALLARPALFHREHPQEQVRAEVLAAAAALFGERVVVERVVVERVVAERVDRRRVLTAEKLAMVHRLRAAGGHSVDELASAVGVSRATLYRYLKSHEM